MLLYLYPIAGEDGWQIINRMPQHTCRKHARQGPWAMMQPGCPHEAHCASALSSTANTGLQTPWCWPALDNSSPGRCSISPQALQTHTNTHSVYPCPCAAKVCKHHEWKQITSGHRWLSGRWQISWHKFKKNIPKKPLCLHQQLKTDCTDCSCLHLLP